MVLTEGNRWVVLMWFGEMDEADIVLSYENSLLYKDDVRLLEPPGWINDSIIEFVFEWVLEGWLGIYWYLLFILV